MKQRIAATFYPEKKGMKKRFYNRITRFVMINLLLTLVLLLVYIVPLIASQIHQLFAPEKKKIENTTATKKDSIGFNANHIPYLYAGHSFPVDSITSYTDMDAHFSKLLYHLDDSLEGRFGLTTLMHKLEEGETLFGIARQYGVSMFRIKAVNNLSDTILLPGKILKIQQTSEKIGYYGIDVSSWQNSIHWENVHDDTIPEPLQFFIIKATQGTQIVDPYFNRNWEKAKSATSIVGAYHFYIPTEDPVVQAANYLQTVKLKKGNFRPIVDVEYDCSACNSLAVSKEKFISDLTIFLNRMEAHYGVKPVLYTYSYFYETYLKGKFDAYTFWIANYSGQKPTGMNVYGNATPGIIPTISMWQFSSTARVDGIVGNVDMSFIPAAQLPNLLY